MPDVHRTSCLPGVEIRSAKTAGSVRCLEGDVESVEREAVLYVNGVTVIASVPGCCATDLTCWRVYVYQINSMMVVMAHAGGFQKL
ncbi:hypothetical protein E2C01_007538 [Portunus trituberculatus]|uniref:Uncharacterized protein n=1 Tax=Portunus trituberculatus TaxID=210409 RepID=A0A5B7D0E0_PORTR|nr:hypothetical protein [Portunus trituberculatus]